MGKTYKWDLEIHGAERGRGDQRTAENEHGEGEEECAERVGEGESGCEIRDGKWRLAEIGGGCGKCIASN